MANENIVIFDKPHPTEKLAEGIAVSWAFVNRHCEVCRFLHRCVADPDFAFPRNAACTVRKKEILREWGAKDGN